MTVFKLRVEQLDTHGHFDVFVGKNEDSLGYAGTMILRKEELVDLIKRIGENQVEDILTSDTPKEVCEDILVELLKLN